MSWEQLIGIYDEAKKAAEEQKSAPPVACPHCGEPLEGGREPGQLHCKFDGWIWR